MLLLYSGPRWRLRRLRRTRRQLKGAVRELCIGTISSSPRASCAVYQSCSAENIAGLSHRMNRKKESAEEPDEPSEEQQLEDAMLAARAVAAVRQAQEMVAEPAVRTHTKFDDEGNVITTYEEQVYDSDGVLRGASSSEEEAEEDTIDEEMMSTIMDAAAAMETIVFTSAAQSPGAHTATGQDTTSRDWRGTHTRFDDDDDDGIDEIVVGRNKNATASGKAKSECLDQYRRVFQYP